jgi:carnosine N-methyltransferase
MKNLQTNLDINELSKNKEEFKRFLVSINGMEKYCYHNRWQIDKIIYDYSNMDKRLLSKMTYDYNTRVKRLEEGVALNQKFLSTILSQYKPDSSFYQGYDQKEIDNLSYNDCGTLNYAVFMYIMRDWTKESKAEREKNYIPIIEQVKKYLKPKSKILLPGAALLRLGYELAKQGYDVDANDYNFTNVILCDYLFNYTKKDQFVFQPLIRSFSNYLSEETIFRKYSFPDEDINLQGKGKLTLAGGDFTQLFKDKNETYDCVITCFFIDTAKNVFEYIDIIQKCLKKGGIWINFGPLSYHWIGFQNIPTIELPYDKLKEVIQNFGFEYLEEEKNKVIAYCEIEGFMKNDFFSCIFFTAKKM